MPASDALAVADPAALARTAAQASLRDLGDELVAASGAVRDAVAGVPMTTLAWAGLDAEAFASTMHGLRDEVAAVRDVLSTASRLVQEALA